MYTMETGNQDSLSKSCTDDFLCSRVHPVSVVDPSEYLVAPQLSSSGSSLDEGVSGGCVKKARLEVSKEGDVMRREHARTCVMHDHSYAIQGSHQQTSSSNSNSDEEGSNSDAGKN